MSDEKNTNEEVVDNSEAGLKAKNKDLLNKLTKANKDKDALEQRLEALEDAAEEAKGTSTELSKAQRALDKAEKELARVNGLYEERGKQLRTTIIQNEINAAFDEANVLPQMKKPLMALYMNEVEWDAETGEGTYNGDRIKQGVAKVLKNKENAVYIAAPDTGGDDAHGNTQTKSTDKWSDLSKVSLQSGNLSAYIDDALKDREAYNARAVAANRPDLVV